MSPQLVDGMCPIGLCRLTKNHRPPCSDAPPDPLEVYIGPWVPTVEALVEHLMILAGRWVDAVLANDDDPDTESGLACAQAHDALKEAIGIAIDRGARREVAR